VAGLGPKQKKYPAFSRQTDQNSATHFSMAQVSILNNLSRFSCQPFNNSKEKQILPVTNTSWHKDCSLSAKNSGLKEEEGGL